MEVQFSVILKPASEVLKGDTIRLGGNRDGMVDGLKIKDIMIIGVFGQT